MKKALQHLSQITIQDDYETPTPLFKWACKKFKIKPKLDVCGSKFHHKTISYFTKDALQKEWNKDFFCNPPYSNVAKFIEKGYNEHVKYNVNGLFLTYAKTDTKWFHKFVQNKAEIYFLKGRIKFWIKGQIPKWCIKCKKHRNTKSKYCYKCNMKLIENPSPYPSMFIIYRKQKKSNKRIGLID